MIRTAVRLLLGAALAPARRRSDGVRSSRLAQSGDPHCRAVRARLLHRRVGAAASRRS